MNKLGRKQSFYVPWSMPQHKLGQKTEHPSVLVDMDEREFTKTSIANGFRLAKICQGLNVKVVIFSKYKEHCPPDLIDKVMFIDPMPHDDFLTLLSRVWVYATGIKGSYEYCILESALLGCGLLSLNDAVLSEHRNRRHFLSFDLDNYTTKELQAFLVNYRPVEVAQDAEKIYPRDSVRALDVIFSEFASN